MKTHHNPIRMCVICRQTSDKKALLRVIRRPQKEGGALMVDPTGRANGRGAYVCASMECIEKAVKQKRFERSLKVPAAPPDLLESLTALCAASANAVAAEASASGASAL